MTDNEILELVKDQVQFWRSELKVRGASEDIIQEVCLKLIEAGQWEHKPAFISSVVKNHLLDMRKKKEIRCVELEEAADVAAPRLSGDRAEWLNKALSSFSWTEQKAIRLRLQGLSLREISLETDLTVEHLSLVIKDTTDRLSEMWNRSSGKS